MEKDKNIGLIVLLSIIFISLLSGICALTIAYKNSETNSVIIYYQGFDTPYIEYRLEKGNWNPKKALEKNNEIPEFTHKVVIPVEDGKGIVAKFSDGKGNVLDNSGRNYEFEKGSWLFFENGAMVRLEDLNKFNIVKFDVQPNGAVVSTGMEVTLSVSTLGGTGPYSYKFMAKDASGAETVIQEFSNANTAKWKPEAAGNYLLTAIAKDSTGANVTKEIEGFKVLSLAINEIRSTLEAPQKVGTTIPLSMDIVNDADLDIKCYYEITSEETNKEKLEASADGKADWNPKEPGKYKITGYVESGKSKISKTIEYEIEEEEADNEVVIYYHSYTSYDIFYCRAKEGSSFSDLEMIGDTMTEDNSQPGYEYKYSTNIADDEVLVVYFLNNQNGDTDDNDGQYYVVRAGKYGIKDNQVYKIADDYSDDNNRNNNHGNNGNNNGNNNNDNDDSFFDWNEFYGRDDD